MLWPSAGFEGRYTNKAGKTAEGSAVFYRRLRFELVHKADIPMKDLFASLLAGDASSLSRHAQFLPLLHASPHLVQALQRVSCQPAFLCMCGPRYSCLSLDFAVQIAAKGCSDSFRWCCS